MFEGKFCPSVPSDDFEAKAQKLNIKYLEYGVSLNKGFDVGEVRKIVKRRERSGAQFLNFDCASKGW